MIQKITSFFLIAVVLLSSLSLSANKMVCLKSGKTKLSLVHMKNCCTGKNDQASTIKSNCCDIQNTFFDLDDFSVSETININSFAWGTDIILHHLFELNDKFDSKTSLLYSDSSPPTYGRGLLTSISILII